MIVVIRRSILALLAFALLALAIPVSRSQASSPASTAAYTCPTTSTNIYAAGSAHQIDLDNPVRVDTQHADKDLKDLRDWVATSGTLGLVSYGGSADTTPPPQLATLFNPYRVPVFSSVYQVYDWNWATSPNPGTRGSPLISPTVTLVGMQTVPGESIRSPVHGYNLGSPWGTGGAMVIFADANNITLTFTRNDSAAKGYTVHIEGICIDPSLLSLYNSLNTVGNTASGRYHFYNNPTGLYYNLPGLTEGQVLGTALGSEIQVSIRDTGSFKDPRSDKDWWQIRPSGPTAPALGTPANGLNTNDSTPTFSWGVVGTGATYAIQINTDPTFVAPPTDSASGLSATTYTPGSALADGTYYWRVNATIAGVTGPWSSSRSFTVDTVPPIAPTLNTPADATFVTSATPALSVVALTGQGTISSYNFQVSTVNTFTSTVATGTSNTTSWTVNPSLGTAYGVYYWRAQAVDAATNAGAWSAPFSFTFTTPLPAPTLSAPAAAALTNVNTPAFSWGAVGGAVDYEIVISTSSTFANTPIVDDNTLTSPSYMSAAQADSVYYWRVRAINNFNYPGTWSASRSFTIDTTPPPPPALSAPAAGVSVRGTLTYSWLAAPTAVGYRFEYSTDAGFSTIVYTSSVVTTTSFKPPPQAVNTTYYWHVLAGDAVGNWLLSTNVPGRAITILPVIPVAPALTTPANGAYLNTSTPTLGWNTVQDANTFNIQVSKFTTFTPLADFSSGQAGTSYTTAALLDGKYYWRVQAVNVNGEPGAWSAARAFTVDTVAPGAPPLSLPADSAFTTSATPALSITAVTGATKYNFRVASDAACTAVVKSGVSATTSFTVPTLGTAYGVYYWCAQAQDAATNQSPWSAIRSFTFTPAGPSAPALTAPASGLQTNNQQPQFTWNASTTGSPASYELQYSTSSTFASNVTDVPGLLATNFTPGPPLPPATYYWRVRGVNSLNYPGAWSTARKLIIDLTPPPVPALYLPANNAVMANSKPTLYTYAAATATHYEFQVSSDSTLAGDHSFASGVVADQTVATTSVVVNPALGYGVYYWHARAQDAAGNWSDWSVVRSFTYTQMTAPKNGSYTLSIRPTFTWVAVTGATYNLQAGSDSTFVTNVVDVTGLTGTSHAIPSLNAPLSLGTNYWRLQVCNPGCGVWMPYWTFTVSGPLVTTAPVMTAPASGAYLPTGTPTFTWNATVVNAASYDIQISTVSTFTTLAASGTGLGGSYTPGSALADHLYYWRVRGVNAQGIPGPWSAARSFTVDTVAPAYPQLYLPLDNASTTSLTPTLYVHASAGAAKYEFQVATDSGFLSIVVDATVAATSYTIPTGKLSHGNTYYWRVQAKDAAGNQSGYGPLTNYRNLHVN